MAQELKITTGETRHDWYDGIDFETNPAQRTKEGFVIARAPVTSIGVFTYRNDDGTPRRELRLPEEVFNSDSLDSLRMKPLTLLHPDVKIVTPENVGELQVGSVGSDVSTDSYRVYVSLSATKQDAIDAVESGSARGLSAGYTCDIEWTSGDWMGMHYDCIQRNIRYNHVALVPAGRAGDDARIRMDSAGIPELPKDFKPTTDEEKMSFKTIHLDGADFQAEPQVIAALDKSQKRCDELTTELEQTRKDNADKVSSLESKLSTTEAERDTYKERLDAMDQEMPGKISAAVKARLDLVGKAQKAGVEVREDMADADIKRAVILKKFPSAQLDGKDESYLSARFDCACEAIDQDAETQSRQDAAEHQDAPHVATAQEKLEESRKNYNARMDSAWQDNPTHKEA